MSTTLEQLQDQITESIGIIDDTRQTIVNAAEDMAHTKALAEAALPVSGGEITGALSLHYNAPRFTLRDNSVILGGPPSTNYHHNTVRFADANNLTTGQLEQQYDPDGSITTRIRVQNQKEDGSVLAANMGVIMKKDGTTYSFSSSHPRINDYGNDLVTTKALKDYAPQCLGHHQSVTIHINADSTNASDTAYLNAGRGLSEDMPFLSLGAAATWAAKHYTNGYVQLLLHSDVEFSGHLSNNAGIQNMAITSDSTKRKILTNGIDVQGGCFSFSNVKFQAINSSIMFFLRCTGIPTPSQLGVNDNCEFEGTVTQGTLVACNVATLTISGLDDFAGSNVTGPRFHNIWGSKIMTQNKGVNYIPGTTAGTTDAGSVYC